MLDILLDCGGLRIAAGQRKNPKPVATQQISDLVPVTGLEPVRCRQRWILSPLRLPFHHTGRNEFLLTFSGGLTGCGARYLPRL